MTSRWDRAELADAGVSVLDCEHKTPPDAGHGHPYVAIPNLVDGRLDLTSVRRITDEHLREWTRRTRPRAGDVIVTRRGRVGDSAVVPEGLSCAIGQNLVILRSVTSRVDQSFLRYAARGRLWADEVDRLRNVGAVFDSLNVRDIARIRIPVPPLREQRAIAATLGVLDDKIDSNRRLSSLLEETVATYFRSRLADFVGVEDFDESEIGPIPRGWTTGSLTTLARFINGKAFTKDANTKGRPILRIKELNAGIRDGTLRSDVAVAEEHLARHHDILFAWSGSLAVYRWSGPESLINQHIFKVIPEGYPPWFVYQWVCQHMPEFQAIARDKATTMGHIQRRHLSEARVALPDSDTLAGVGELLEPLDRWQGVVASEIASLAAIRDALLPKLISGEIRVSDTADSDEVIGLLAERLAGAKR
jgi:type I restriction enzyme, S subunit